MILTAALVTASLVINTHCRPLLRDDTISKSAWAWRYLETYGYIPDKLASANKENILAKAIADFQSFSDINMTAALNAETLALMHRPRCGNKDMLKVRGGRSKRFALHGSRWQARKLLYKISSYPPSRVLSKREVDEAMEEALKVWSDVADLEFERVETGVAHIDIQFGKGEHGDDDPFDGRGGTLAHAFFPLFGGDIHFDSEERWTVKTSRGVSLAQSAAHEIGHSLGLRHSSTRSALMAPFYRGYEENIQLDRDDIRGIQELYGAKIKAKPEIVVKSASDEERDSLDINNPICASRKIDVIVTDKEGRTYVFQGHEYWVLDQAGGLQPGFPRRISDDWPGIPNNLNAAFSWTNGKIYFFKGSQYWRASTDGQVDQGFPRSIDAGFPGIPDSPDAAIVWGENDKIYFFKGSRYWRLDPKNVRQPVDKSYPRNISNWAGVPNNLDTAMQYSDGQTYFFKNDKYYKFDDQTLTVQEDEPSYPRDTRDYWFGCRKRNSPLLYPKNHVAFQ